MKINQLKEKTVIDIDMLLTKCTKGSTANGEPYLSLTLEDNSGSIDGKVWNVKPVTEEKCKVGKVVKILANVNLYQGNLQLKINDVVELDQSGFDLNEFIKASPINQKELKKSIESTIESINNPILKDVVKTIVTKHQDKIYDYPAASRNHHDFKSGLALHTVGMIELGEKLIEIYPNVNRDLLLSGIILHDVGKVHELNGFVATEYTMEGRLIGHISLMHAEVFELANSRGYNDSEEVILLRHMILSHHGEMAYGSPVVPMIREAELLSFIDNIDARMNMIDKAIGDLNQGTFTQRIFPLENRCFYKPKGDI